ncbi:integrase arm-type DNA-binding domain-containing protein [Polynucleobacter paneuropaeus]|nr:integrase arm-type DNA-binding domain-containing protein [Polynucleobacter paneuropaeus]
MSKLSAPNVINAKDGLHSDGHGLYLKVNKAKGTKAWVYRFQLNKARREMGMGSAHLISLKEARDQLLDLRKSVRNGVDPIESRKQTLQRQKEQAESSINFIEAANRYIAQHEAGLSNKAHARQWPNTMRDYVFPIIGTKTVSSICLKDILAVLTPIWGSKTETATRVRARIEKIIDWCTARGYRSGENPARWSLLATQFPSPKKLKNVQHHKALVYTSINSFISSLRKQSGISALALEFLIQTASRTGEVLGATWDEVDIPGKTWNIPANRMKARKEHRVALNDRAIAILKGLMQIPSGSIYIFPSPISLKPLSNVAMAKSLKKLDGEATVHGFRSCFKDWAAEQTSHPNIVSEMALAHAIGGVEGAYRRGDLLAKRAALMADWGSYIETKQTLASVALLSDSMVAA